MAGRILVVSAFPPDQAFLLEMGHHFPSHRFDFVLCGVGAVRAATATTAALATALLPERVVFCGTAGSYSTQNRIASAHRIQHVRATDAGLLLGLTVMPGQKGLFDEIVSPIAQPNTPIAVSPSSQSRDLALTEKCASLGAFECLELYGVALATTTARVPWEAFLGVSHYVGLDGLAQWKQNHREAGRAAGELLWRSLFP